MIKRIIARLRDSKGFTLVETLVVVTIIGVMASVAVVAVGSASSDGKAAACKNDLSTLNTAADSYKAATGAYPTGTDAGAAITALSSYLRKSPAATGLSYATGTFTSSACTL